tara:strand:- start:43 stop:459 length:417 start_codon:yes stop_codon:yes gene_type:complete
LWLEVVHLPKVVYDGPLPTQRVGWGTLIRGQVQEISQETLDTFRNSLTNCRIWEDAPATVEVVSVDAGLDGIPDSGWTRNDIISWLTEQGVSTRAGLTKAQLLSRVDAHLNPVEEEEVSEESISEASQADNNDTGSDE